VAGDSPGLIAGGGWWQEIPTVSPSGPERFPSRWIVVAVGFLLAIDIPAGQTLFAADTPMWFRVVAGLLLLVYNLCYIGFPLILPRGDPRIKFGYALGMLAVGWALLILFGLGSLPVMIYAMAGIAFALPAGWVLVLDGGTLLALMLVLVVAGRFSDQFGNLITVLSVTAALFFVGRLVRAIRRLRQANDEIATLAVTAERERLARDLHDILGHSLTTITVKAGLARRVLESSGDEERAIAEIREVEGLARSALSDVRATVSEYREVSLSAELVGARTALRAAEVGADLPYAVDNVRPDLQGVFGYVLREATTNVLRHANARQVRVRFGRTWMEVEDDGPASGEVEPGNGLRGLRERLAQAGGTLTLTPRPGGGLVLRADAPAESQDAGPVASTPEVGFA
jgi:two-component system sensor histidine kinase DesK